MAHNHPAGDPTPSRQDIATTGQLREAGKIVGIGVVEHVIVAEEAYFSFEGEGLMGGDTVHGPH